MRMIGRVHAARRRIQRLVWCRGDFWLVRADGRTVWDGDPTPRFDDWDPLSGDVTMRARTVRLDDVISSFELPDERIVWRLMDRTTFDGVDRDLLIGACIIDRAPLAATLVPPDARVPGRRVVPVAIRLPAGTTLAPIGAMSDHPAVHPADVLLPRDARIRIDAIGRDRIDATYLASDASM